MVIPRASHIDAFDKTTLTQKLLALTLFQRDPRKRALDEGIILGREQNKHSGNSERGLAVATFRKAAHGKSVTWVRKGS
jgi:hypothetical protein